MSPGGRPQLPLGTYGTISVSEVGPVQYKARARYRARDGRLRTMARFGQTKGAARDSLRSALAEWQRTGQPITSATKVSDIAKAWLVEVQASNLAPQTKEHYDYCITRYLTPTVGALRVADVTTSIVDGALKRITAESGPSAAKSAKAVLSGVFKYAARHDAMTSNPVREVAPISLPRRRPKHLTDKMVEDLTDQLRSDPEAVRLDLPDLADLMLGTGVRIGEACALRDGVLNPGVFEINATVIRLKGRGLFVQERAKSAAGWRQIAVPSYVGALIQRRRGELRLQPASVACLLEDGATVVEREGMWVALPAPTSQALRDPSNTPGDLRRVLDRLGWDWVTSHTFRKTVATKLEEAGCTPREIADHLGHADPAMTLRVYMGREVVTEKAALVLDR